jgi:hypothetical protein
MYDKSMTTTTKKLSAAQIKTLATIIANGGEMNTYAGQEGLFTLSVRPLRVAGLVESIHDCAPCSAGWGNGKPTCASPMPGQKGGETCYYRIRVTDAGRTAHQKEAR